MMSMNRRKFINLSAILGIVGLSQYAAGNKNTRRATPEEIEGPFYPLQLNHDSDFDLTQIINKIGSAKGEKIILTGKVTDTEGKVIPGVTIDLWQANAAGRYRHPHDNNPAPIDKHFQGRGVVLSSQDGSFRFKTIIPGAYPISPQWIRPPHIHFKISKKGYFEFITQMYFEGMHLNAADRLLQSKNQEEQSRMIATKGNKTKEGLSLFYYNVVLKKA